MRLKEFAPSGDSGGSGDYFQALASAWYNGTFDSGSLQKGIKSQQDVEQLLQRGIIGPDGVTRKYGIDYNSTFDGVVISSDDYYEHADHDETDSRTGKPFGPYDYMEFSDEQLDEATGDKKFDSMLSRMTAEPKYPDQDMPPTSIAELIQWADRNNKPYHEYFAQWARRNGFKNVNDALVWFGDNVDPSNPWGPKDFLDPFGRPAAEELEDAAKHDPKAAELMKVFRCYEEIVFDWPDEYRQMNMPVSRKGTDESLTEFAPDSNDGGGEDDALHNYARMWWTGDEATQMQIERALAKMGWEIGEDEGGYDNGGVFVIRAGDINGDSYTSWAAEDLTEGLNEVDRRGFLKGLGAAAVAGAAGGATAQDRPKLAVEVGELDTSTKDYEPVNSGQSRNFIYVYDSSVFIMKWIDNRGNNISEGEVFQARGSGTDFKNRPNTMYFSNKNAVKVVPNGSPDGDLIYFTPRNWIDQKIGWRSVYYQKNLNNIKESQLYEDSQDPQTIVRNMIALEYFCKSKMYNAEFFGFKIGESYFVKNVYNSIEQFIEKHGAKGNQIINQMRTEVYEYLGSLGKNNYKEYQKTAQFMVEHHKKIINAFQQLSTERIQGPGKSVNQGVAEGAPISGDGGAVDNFRQQMANNTELAYQKGMAEAKKKKKKKSSKSLRGYFFPGYGYYGAGESGEGGGDGGGGESKNRDVAEGDLNEKSTSQAQFRTMAAAAHDPEFARKVGIKPSVAREFNQADRGQNYKSLPKKAD